MKLLNLLIILLLFIPIISCSMTRNNDANYVKSNIIDTKDVPIEWKNAIGRMGKKTASCVCIGYKGEYSIVLTAKHVIQIQKNWCYFNDKEYKIENLKCHPNKDICAFEIYGHVPSIKPIDINESDGDITIGYVKGQLTIKNGRAIPGQSGGGCFSVGKGLFAVVSTTGTGVKILPALREMGISVGN